jgi:hypothetical protein
MTDRRPPKILKYVVPAACDLLSSLLEYVSIIKLNGSTYQFLNNGMLITAGIFSYFMTRVAFNRNQIWGGVIAFVALLIATGSELLGENK